MFFNLHTNATIGYKLLSDADLGISRGNTTHIGLLTDSFNFLTGYHQESSSQLIYNETTTEVIAFLDLVTSPKLKVCNNIEAISHNFVKNLNEFNAKIELEHLKNNGMKISLNPTHPLLNFNNEIIL